MKHRLKTDPAMFQSVWDDKKTFELRLNDRGFKVGDELLLLETRYTGCQMENGSPLEYTGRGLGCKVTQILQAHVGLERGWCVLSLNENKLHYLQVSAEEAQDD